MRLIIDNIATKVVSGGKDNLLPVDIMKELDNYLKIRVEGYHRTEAFKKGRWDGYKHFLTAAGYFATGFLPMVLMFLKEHNVKIEFEDKRTNIPRLLEEGEQDFGGEGKQDREYQRDAIISVDNWLEYDGQKIYFPRGIWEAAPNFGKSWTMALLLMNIYSEDTIKAIVMIHNELLLKQLYALLSQYFNVGIIHKTKLEIDKPVVLAMYKTLYNKEKSSVNVKKELKKFNVLLVDECHKAGGDQYSTLLSKVPAAMRVFVSGTALEGDNDIKNMTIVGLSGSVLFKKTKKELMEEGVSMQVHVHVHLNKPSSNAYKNYDTAVKSGLHYSAERVATITDILRNSKKKAIVTFINIDHGEFLYDVLSTADLGRTVELTHGTDKEKEAKIERLRSGETEILIVSQIMKEGVDVPDINMMVYAQGGKSKITLSQFSGRIERHDGTDEEVELHDFYDDTKWLVDHSKARIKTYRKEGFKVTIHYDNKKDKPIYTK